MKASTNSPSLLARARLRTAQLLASKAMEQAAVEALTDVSHNRELTDAERETLLVALRAIRTLSKRMAQRRGVVLRKGGPRA